MSKKYIIFSLAILIIFLTACTRHEPSNTFGECIIAAEYEDLTQTEYTGYMQEAYGLDTLEDHKVFHNNGMFQIDFQFSKDIHDWQIDSAKEFAISKFYLRDPAKYDLWNYDTWLIEHMDEESVNVTYRIFVGQDIIDTGVYPDS